MSAEQRKQLADTIKAIRRLRGMSQRELASKVGCSTRQIQNIENGCNTTLEMLDKISEVLNYNLY